MQMWEPTPMRRQDRMLEHQAACALLRGGEWGVLATAGAGGLPLATPLSYVLLDDGLYFHCAHKGQKMDNLAACSRVCFVVVGATQPVYSGTFSAYYQSVVVHGNAALVEDPARKTAVLTTLAEKYLPAHSHKAPGNIEQALAVTCVVRITIDEITGKENAPAEEDV